MSKNLSPEFLAGMQDIAKMLDGKLKPHQFILLTFPKDLKTGEQLVNYVSNGKRPEMVTALKEILARFEGRSHKAPAGVQ